MFLCTAMCVFTQSSDACKGTKRQVKQAPAGRMHFQWQDLGALQLLSVHAATTTHQGLPFEVEVCHELRSDMNRSAMDGFRRSAQWTATDWTFKPQT
jgi:hypothetical protein